MRKLNLLFSLLVAVGSVVTCAGSAQAVNLLANGSLDVVGGAVITGWTTEQSKALSGPTSDLITLEPWIEIGPVTLGGGDPDQGGFVKAFQGATTPLPDYATLHLSQAVAGLPGLQYLLTGWIGAGNNYSGLLTTDTQTLLAIDFDGDNDRANGVLSSAVLDVKAAGLTSGGCCDFGAKQFAVQGTAPGGTLFVHARFSMVNGHTLPGGGDQAAFIDDFSLDLVPEPASAALGLIGILGFLGLARRR